MKPTKLSLIISSGLLTAFLLVNIQTHAQNWSAVTGISNVQDIAVGKTGAVWATGTDQTIYRRNQDSWETMTGGASRIAVDTAGSAWVVNDGGSIYRYNLGNQSWTLLPGRAKDIAVGANGSVWVIGMNA